MSSTSMENASPYERIFKIDPIVTRPRTNVANNDGGGGNFRILNEPFPNKKQILTLPKI